MEERSKGISLRKKRSVRPKVNARQISAPLTTPLPQLLERPRLTHQNSSTLSVPRERPHADGNTVDYVKRRYSTRITQLKDIEAPAVPSLPSKFSHAPSQIGGFGGEHVAIDPGALQDPDLQPEHCKMFATVLASTSDISK